MADRAAAGRDLLAAQIGKTLDRRVFGHEDREPLAGLPDRGDRLHRRAGGGGEGEGRIADEPGLDRAGAQRLEQRRGRRKLLPLDLVGNVLEHARGFHHGLRIALLVADAQRGLRGGEIGAREASAAAMMNRIIPRRPRCGRVRQSACASAGSARGRSRWRR